MVMRMSGETRSYDELDPYLLRAFAEAGEPPGGNEFLVRLLQKIEQTRRARRWGWGVAAAALIIVVALNLRLTLHMTAAAVRLVGDFSPADMQVLISPAGWAVSMLVGGGVLLLMRPSSR
jgi:hypothetical protein